jgi:hypothetical protein
MEGFVWLSYFKAHRSHLCLRWNNLPLDHERPNVLMDSRGGRRGVYLFRTALDAHMNGTNATALVRVEAFDPKGDGWWSTIRVLEAWNVTDVFADTFMVELCRLGKEYHVHPDVPLEAYDLTAQWFIGKQERVTAAQPVTVSGRIARKWIDLAGQRSEAVAREMHQRLNEWVVGQLAHLERIA